MPLGWLAHVVNGHRVCHRVVCVWCRTADRSSLSRQALAYSAFRTPIASPSDISVSLSYRFPHGAFPIAPVVAGTLMQTLFPHMMIYSVAASVVFYIPFWRHFITWIGSVPATSQNFKRLLKKGSVAVVVGGIAEMYMGHPHRERIKLKGRRGFAKIALEEQVDGIVCVYYFGQSQVLSFGPAWLAGVSRRLRTSFGYLTGWMGLPVPKPLPIYMVNGRPIPVPKVPRDSPDFDKEVDKLLDACIKELGEMYDRHRAEYGWSNRPLSIE
ncbi:hypothetical protein Vafri_7066 [Volvox africanus]|uniref:Acyltransferase n=1 Tax=Volvox africanus TaxID=51714 RepID=A0A8J4EYU0_9CHLO|nr:hypothetical protein Vafri_7066 [Volvox africanus]